MATPEQSIGGAMADHHRVIGFSSAGRPLLVRHFGSAAAPLRIFLLCGQHGDERGVRRALAEFLAGEQAASLDASDPIQLAVLIDANPDGAAAGTRNNAQGVDLNRDHVLLEAPETRAIHRFVSAWEPHLVIDLHNYPSRRIHLVRRNVRLAWDVCLDYPSNPATLLSGGHPLLDSLMGAIDRRLCLEGHPFGRYCIVDGDGDVRHGTPELVDARNVLSLRYGCLTLLLEARNPGRCESKDERSHVRRAVAEALRGLLAWCREHEAAVARLRADGASQTRIPLRYRRRPSEEPAELPVVDLLTGAAGTMLFPRFRPIVEGRRTITAPEAYAVPASQTALLALLARHGYHGRSAQDTQRHVVEDLYLRPSSETPLGLPRSRQRRPAPRVERTVAYERALQGFVVFPFRQRGGRFLALLLEPESRYALHRYSQTGLSAEPASLYPIRRVIQTFGPIGCETSSEVTI